MEITVALIITAITLVAGQITKLTNLDNKWIPLQNIIIAIIIFCRGIHLLSKFVNLVICPATNVIAVIINATVISIFSLPFF